MKERPIIFSAPMVKAILDSRKSQTRRTINWNRTPYQTIGETDDGDLWPWIECRDEPEGFFLPCPYGDVGDQLYVRENHRFCKEADNIPARYIGPAHRIWYEADAPHQPGFGKLRPSIYLPRWASRITLEITDIRVERLHDITPSDAISEGVTFDQHYEGAGNPCDEIRAIEAFRDVWVLINGIGSWDKNPFVWRITFRRVQ